MDVLSQLDNLEQNLLNSRELSNTLYFINNNIEILAPHLNLRLLHDLYGKFLGKSDVSGIRALLSKIYFIRDDYMKSIEFFDFQNEETSFYYNFVHNKIIDIYLKDRNSLSEESQKYVENILKNENNIGLFLETKRYEDINVVKDENTLKVLKKMMQLEKFHSLVISLDLKNFSRFYIDALIYLECLKFEKPDFAILNELKNIADDDERKEMIHSITYNEVESLNIQYESIARVVQNYINSLPFIEQYNASHYLSEAYPQVACSIENDYTQEILNGNFRKMLHKSYIVRVNKSNFTIFSSLVRGIKKNLKQLNLSLVFANTFINLCTGNDTFYRKNESFFRNLKGWNKYISIQCFGLIHLLSNHEGNMEAEKPVDERERMSKLRDTREDLKLSGGDDSNQSPTQKKYKFIEILQDLLPGSIKTKNVVTDNVNSTESAALHALGFAGQDPDFIYNFLESENFFGSTLGISNQLFGSMNELLTMKFYENLKKEDLHYEAFAYAIGQINAKSLNLDILMKLESIIRLTEHSRIAHSCAAAMSIIAINDRSFPLTLHENDRRWQNFDFNDPENPTVKGLDVKKLFKESKEMLKSEYDSHGLEKLVSYFLALLKSQNAFLRLAGTKCLGTFFIKTGNVRVIDKLFNMVKDNSEDVRRAAVLSLGLVVQDKNLVKMLNFFVLSHCSFVRSAVALTLGLFLAGTGNSDVVDLLETLLYDVNPLVVQSACLGLGLLLMQGNSAISNYKRIVNKVDLIILRGSEISSKFGGLIFRGLLNLGNGSLCITYKNIHGTINYKNISYFILFFDYNYFYMLMIYLGLCANVTVYYGIKIISDPNTQSHSEYNPIYTFKNIRFSLSGTAQVESKKRIGYIEEVALPKRKLKKFRRRSEIDSPATPDLRPSVNIKRTSNEKTYTIKSGDRMTLRELMRSDKKNFSIEFIDDK